MRQWLKRIVIGIGLSLGLPTIAVWVLWIPSAQEPAYVFAGAWGETGTGPRQFRDPTGIAVSADEVFVSDARNARIQVFDYRGRFLRQIDGEANTEAELGRPMNLSIHRDELYVADYWNDRVQIYGLDGTYRRSIGRSGTQPGAFDSPGGVAVNANGDLFVADFYNQRVQHLRADGQYIEHWGTSRAVGVRAGEFNYPTDVAIDAEGQLLVADGYNDRIQMFDASGSFLRKWGGPFGMNIFGPFRGWFATVTSVAVGPQGNVFVADFYNDRVQKFDREGRFLTSFGESGTGDGQFSYITAVAVAPDGTVFASDLGNNRVLYFVPPEQTH
ncbi:MAG: 6-bladed beta-propeller [Gammaproteobacteria bacterium]|nr:6-bladed beta-propeller [Gammaproteobacteria bacterium]